MTNGECAKCARKCTGCGKTVDREGSHCKTCDAKRQQKWATNDQLEARMADIQKSTISAMDAKFEQLQQVLLNSIKPNNPSPEGNPTDQENGLTKPPASTTGQNGHSSSAAGAPPKGQRRHSTDHLDSIQREEDFNPDYEEQDEVQSNGSEEQEVVDVDSVSLAGTESRMSSVPEAERTKKMLLMAKLKSWASLEESDPEEEPPTDLMAAELAGAGLTVQKKSQGKGLWLVEAQEALLKSAMSSQDPTAVRVFSDKERKGLQVDDAHFGWFRTPSLNKTLVDRFKIMKENQGGSKTSDTAKVSKTFKFSNPQRSAQELGLHKVDQAARVGMKYSVYSQWLTLGLKTILKGELGEDHPLLRPEGDVCQIINELLAASSIAMQQGGRVTALATVERRKNYLQDMQTKQVARNMALELPVDPKGINLFGATKDEDGESVSVEGILTKYAEHVQELKETALAFNRKSWSKTGFAKQNNTGRSPAHKRKHSPKRDSHKGGAEPAKKPRFEQNRNQGQGRGKTEHSKNANHSGYKPQGGYKSNYSPRGRGKMPFRGGKGGNF
jgi:hypothetical protein